MTSTLIKAQLSVLYEYRLRAAFALLVGLALAYVKLYKDPFWGNLLPELLGAVLVYLLVELFWNAQAYELFRREMQSLRTQIRIRVDKGTLSPDQAQDVIADVIPVMSRVFFGGRDRPLSLRSHPPICH